MGDEAEEVTTDVAEPSADTGSDDVSLGDVYDRVMTDHEPEDRARDELGRFVAVDDNGGRTEQAPDTLAAEPGEESAEEVEEPAEEAEAPDEVAATPDEDETNIEEVEADQKEPEGPSHLPLEIRQHWADIPKEAQDAIARSQLELSGKLAEAGRQIQGIGPVHDAIVEMSKEFPELMNMTPAEIAADTKQLAMTRVQLLRDPVNTLLSVARQLGALPQMQQALQNATPESLAAMQQPQQLQQQENPVNVSEIVQQALAERDVSDAIASFPEGKQHWAAVEEHMPRFVEAAWTIKGEGTPYKGILQTAYDMAIAELGLMAEPKASSGKDVPKSSPKRTEAVIRAKSVNVASGSGKAKPLSENEALGAAYDRARAG